MKGYIPNDGRHDVETLKQDAIQAISGMPDSVTIDEIMYKLYLLEKVRKGKQAADEGKFVSVGELKKEMESW